MDNVHGPALQSNGEAFFSPILARDNLEKPMTFSNININITKYMNNSKQ